MKTYRQFWQEEDAKAKSAGRREQEAKDWLASDAGKEMIELVLVEMDGVMLDRQSSLNPHNPFAVNYFTP